MKAFKKVLSLALACVMALPLLTACGGGSKPSTPVTIHTSKIASIFATLSGSGSAYGNTYYWDYSFKDEFLGGTAHPIIASKSTGSYIEAGSLKAWSDDISTYVPANQYFETTGKDNVLIKVDYQPFTVIGRSYELNYNPLEDILTLDAFTSFSTGTTKVNGTNYYSETVTMTDAETNSPVTMTFCFQNDTWKYLIYSAEEYGEQHEYLMTINRFTTNFDESIVDIPDTYTEILTPSEYLSEYGG